MKNAQYLYPTLHHSIRDDKGVLPHDQLAYIRYDRGTAGSGKLSKLFEVIEEIRNDLQCRIGAKHTLVVLVNAIEVTFSLFSQYYAQHVLPT